MKNCKKNEPDIYRGIYTRSRTTIAPKGYPGDDEHPQAGNPDAGVSEASERGGSKASICDALSREAPFGFADGGDAESRSLRTTQVPEMAECDEEGNNAI